ncbi:MAG: hypothetical protein ABEJ76_07910 [Halanaeroarchaeum sp.]
MQSNVSTIDGSGVTREETPGGGPLSNGSSSLSRDVVFDVLSSTRRRYVLHHLRQNGGTANLRDLSTIIAAWEYETTPENVTSKQRTRVYTALRQSHLPKMDREGIVEFDPSSGDVTVTPDAEDLEIYLDIVPHDEIPWSTYYLGVGALGSVVAVTTWLDVFPLAYIPDGLAAVALALIVIVSASAHSYFDRKYRIGEDDRPPA